MLTYEEYLTLNMHYQRQVQSVRSMNHHRRLLHLDVNEIPHLRVSGYS
jgi:hypothetical protein